MQNYHSYGDRLLNFLCCLVVDNGLPIVWSVREHSTGVTCTPLCGLLRVSNFVSNSKVRLLSPTTIRGASCEYWREPATVLYQTAGHSLVHRRPIN